MGSSTLVVAAAILLIALITWLSFGSERRFRRAIASRATLDDREFVSPFYAGSQIPTDIPLRLRPIYCRYFNIEIGKIRPSDKPPEISDLDTVDLVRQIEVEFGVAIPDKDAEGVDGSFDSIVRYLASHSPT